MTCGALTLLFGKAAGCLPERMILTERDGTAVPLLDRAYTLEAELADGAVIHPVVPDGGAGRPAVYERDGAQYVEFFKLPWADRAGRIIPDFHFSIRHEFLPDGAAFSTAFFTVEQSRPAVIKRFELTAPLKLENCSSVRWGVNNRRRAGEANLLQSIELERFLPRGADRVFAHGIFPTAGFCARKNNAPALYAEFFVEGDNTVSGDPSVNSSSITWQKGNPTLRWNFQTAPSGERRLPLHWRNCWGWFITNPPAQRHLPPLRMYHYFDLAKHYPDAEQMRALADAGCDLLILHENWRLDVQNDGTPYDPVRFLELVRMAHHANIRVAVYMRGNEISAREDDCAWFRKFLRPGFDGLYMDYGGPDGEFVMPDETFQNGRILFREYYHKMKRLRAMIGRDGVFYSHTGPWFSAVGMTFVDGYVSGEGERGVMVKGRLEHEYFSMAYAVPGAMWTAAFPEYSSPKMVPFLAAAGQYPHNPLGVQFPASSLVHPPEPGINDLCFRPLWKLWSCFRNEKDLAVFNDYNCRDVFKSGSGNVGFYLLVAAGGEKGLLIAANFRDAGETVRFSFDRAKTGLKTGHAVMLTFGENQTPLAKNCGPVAEYEFTLPAYGVAGLLFTDSENDRDAMLKEYLRPYHRLGAAGRQFLAEIKTQNELRHNPPDWPEVWLKIVMPFYPPLPYEDSMAVDLYNETMELGELDGAGNFHSLGWLGRTAFTREETAAEDKIFLGDVSSPVPLHQYLTPGRHTLAVRSWRLGAPFYSFIEAQLSSAPDGGESYTVKFFNALEPDRAYLRWETLIG